MKIAFVFAPEMVGGRPLDFTAIATHPRGLTGSESSILYFARELVKRGHACSLFIPSPNAPAWDGVTLTDLARLPALAPSFDVVCSWIYSRFLRGVPTSVLRVVNQTCNSFDYEEPHFEDDVDLFLSPSEPHMRYMRKWTLTHTDKWKVLRLGCYVDDYGIAPKVSGRCVYISSPDRGLHLVLQEWPKIQAALRDHPRKDELPKIHLKIFYYALDVYLHNYYSTLPRNAEATLDNIEHGCRARYIEAALKRLTGVEVVGSVSRETMRRELSEAVVLTYPATTTSFSEGFSCSTLEGCAAGALPVLVGVDALGGVYQHALDVVPPPAHENIAQWRDLVVRALTDEAWRSQKAAVARDFAAKHDYRDIAVDLEKIFQDGVDEKRRAPAVSTKQGISLDFLLTPFAAGGNDPIPVEDPKETRGGGSRVSMMRLARAMARRGGYEVRVFSRVDKEVKVDGVDHAQFEKIDRNSPRDVVMAYYDTTALRGFDGGCLRIASHHTYVPPDVAFSNFTDVNTAPTQHAVDHLRKAFDPHGTWYTLPNGIEDPFINRQPVYGRVLYHTSPDRGLHLLFKAWPTIKKAVPEATLHVTGDVNAAAWNGAPLYPSFARSVPGQRILALRSGLDAARAAGGVELLGKISSDHLRHELGQAAVFAYPCSVFMPCETFSACIMECMQAGVPVVLSPQDALGMYHDMAVVTPSPAEEHLDEFADAVIGVLKSKALQLSGKYMGHRFAIRYTFDRMAAVLDQIIRKHLP